MTTTSQRELHTDPSLDLSVVGAIVTEHGRGVEALIPMLQAIQRHYRYLPEAALRRLCEISDITPALVAGVSTFYTQFRHQPVGRHIVSLCNGTACHVKGAELVYEALRRHLALGEGEDTDAEGAFTVQKVACLGCCTLAPVVQIDGVTYGHQTPDTIPGTMRDFLELERRGLVNRREGETREKAGDLAEIRIGVGSCCVAGGSLKVCAALERAIHEMNAPAVVKPVGCVGMCHQTPLVEIILPGSEPVFYARMRAEDAEGIVRRHFKPRGLRVITSAVSTVLDRLLTDETWTPVTRYALDTRDAPVCAFLGRQKHIATEFCGDLDPLDLDEYLAHQGFRALERCREMPADEIIRTVTTSGLRGRGGAGFPTGLKWSLTAQAPGETKYVICNGDEGDPGAFMDRMILESYPYRVLEGMAVAASAVGAREGILYIRAEYPLAVRRIREAIKRGTEQGLFGDLHLRVMEGAGAFVCGEETALLASLEGRRGMPSLRPPFPAEKGLHGLPTLINNVETFATVPWILRHGAEEYAALGTPESKGTKVFALAGKIARGGLIEVPMGITIREIVEEIGGGVAGGRRFKAVQIGGPSGGCIPAELADTPVSYESLTALGAIMGSGGLVVIDDGDCMVDIARYFLEFTQHQSCGKCTFCRVGTRRMLDILERLCTGRAHHGDLEKLEELAVMVGRASLCGLGRTAPNPVLSTLRFFREEYEAHLHGRCPAGKCRALIRYRVTDDCIGCTRCAQVCPADAIPLTPYEKHVIDDDKCTRCDTCKRICPVQAIDVE